MLGSPMHGSHPVLRAEGSEAKNGEVCCALSPSTNYMEDGIPLVLRQCGN